MERRMIVDLTSCTGETESKKSPTSEVSVKELIEKIGEKTV